MSDDKNADRLAMARKAALKMRREWERWLWDVNPRLTHELLEAMGDVLDVFGLELRSDKIRGRKRDE